MSCNVCSAGAGEPKALIRGKALSQDERGLIYLHAHRKLISSGLNKSDPFIICRYALG